jgi:phosphonoacetate hydrolase
MTLQSPVTPNGRTYAAPQTCAIAICLDGCEPAYVDEAVKAGLMPHLSRIKESGTVRFAHSVIPSFTNPNNLSIATGQPPAVHGICGDFLYDTETGEEVMMNDVRNCNCRTNHRRCASSACLRWFPPIGDALRSTLAEDKCSGPLSQITVQPHAPCPTLPPF